MMPSVVTAAVTANLDFDAVAARRAEQERQSATKARVVGGCALRTCLFSAGIVEQRGTIRATTPWRTAARRSTPPARAVRSGSHHHLRPPAGRAVAMKRGDRRHLPRRLGDVGQGIDGRGSVPISPTINSARFRRGGPSSAHSHRRPQPAVRHRFQDTASPPRRLPPVHHRRRRHRARRRPSANLIRRFVEAACWLPRDQPGVKKCGHQGGKVLGSGRADQAAQRRPLPARRDGGPRHHRGRTVRSRPPPRGSGDERDQPFLLGDHRRSPATRTLAAILDGSSSGRRGHLGTTCSRCRESGDRSGVARAGRV